MNLHEWINLDIDSLEQLHMILNFLSRIKKVKIKRWN